MNSFTILEKILQAMLTLKTILHEVKDVPEERLEELRQVLQSYTPSAKVSDELRKEILSYGGAFSDMSSSDYKEYLRLTKNMRYQLF